MLRALLAAALALLPGAALAQAPTPAPGNGASPAAVPAGWDVPPLRHVDQARVRAELGRILATDELQAAGQRRGATTVLASVWRRVQAWIGRQPVGVTRGVVVACLVVLLLVAAHLAWSMGAVLRGERRRGHAGPAAEERRSPEEARAAAASAAAAGDYAGGVRLLYLAALRVLERAGVCDLGAGTADWTVVARCRSAPGLEEPLRGLVQQFQESRFGGRACGREQYDECAAHLEAILRRQAPDTVGAGGREAAA